MEIVSFFHQILTPLPCHLPKSTVPHHPSWRDSSSPPSSQAQSFYSEESPFHVNPSLRDNVTTETSPFKVEFSFDFRKLTILFLRGVMKDNELVGRKVGTAVLSHAKIEASVGMVLYI